MTRYIRRRIGQLITAGFEGTSIPVELRSMAREFQLGGVILFGRNVEEPVQIAELSHDAQQLAADLPLWVSVDQEGGRVARLREPFTIWPAMRTLGRCGDVMLARQFGAALAQELATVGISLDYAPVLDVHTNADNPVIGDRALSNKADDVARIGSAIIEALQEEGVAACGKHFPGHGDTSVDSHHDLPVVEHPTQRLTEVELEPFRAAVAADVAMIMTAHVVYPALDEDKPATLSRRIVTELLREEMGFEGVIATDDMGMSAIAKGWPLESATVDSLAAGCDMVLLCEPNVDGQVAALEAVIRAVEDGTLPETRIEDALMRQERTKARFLGRAKAWRPPRPADIRQMLRQEEHAVIAKTMGQYV